MLSDGCGVGWGGRREAREGRDVCILIADSHCTAETNRILYNNYTPINFLKNGKTRTLNRSSQFQKVTSVHQQPPHCWEWEEREGEGG